MPRLFYDGAAMLMMRSAIVFGLFWVVSAGTASAQDALPVGCSVTAVNMVTQDQGTVTIDCSGLSEAFGKDFADILTRILQDRLDPQMVMAKLDEVDQIPDAGGARTVDENQRQLIIQSLFGKPPGQIAITAHPKVDDSAEFAKAIATSLLQAGWQIEGQQIRRAAPPSLDHVPGLAIVVHDKGVPCRNRRCCSRRRSIRRISPQHWRRIRPWRLTPPFYGSGGARSSCRSRRNSPRYAIAV